MASARDKASRFASMSANDIFSMSLGWNQSTLCHSMPLLITRRDSVTVAVTCSVQRENKTDTAQDRKRSESCLNAARKDTKDACSGGDLRS